MRVGSLFAGIGGFDLAASRVWGWDCVKWQVEIDPWCRRVLAKHWPDVQRHGDIREVSGDELEPVDLICGGFPCQPFSVAGEQRGTADDRYLWPEMARVIAAKRPRWVVGENVPGLRKLALDGVLSHLEDLGYTVATISIPACALGAPHRRERLWIVAYSRREGLECRGTGSGNAPDPEVFDVRAANGSDPIFASDASLIGCGSRGTGRPFATANRSPRQAHGGNGDAANADQERRDGRAGLFGARRRGEPTHCDWWAVEPDVGRVVNGLSGRVERLKGLGNAVVPQIPELLFRWIDEIEKQR